MNTLKLGMETETLEFKKSTGEIKEAMISIVAILNKHQSGELYFGVLPDGTPIGQIINEKTLRDVSNAIKNHIEPKIYPEIKIVYLNDRPCVHVKFEGSEVPYYAYGQVKIRVADEDLPMFPQEIENRYKQKNNSANLWENNLSEWKVQDAKDDILEAYIDKAYSVKRIDFEYSDKKTVLNKLFLTKEDTLLNAGAVLFCDTNLCELQMAIFATEERLTFNDIQRYHGTVFELVDLAEIYIVNNIHWRVEFDGSIQRKEIPEVPTSAIREALINSFCHKDYNARQCNEVTIYKNRIEIYNPGAFPSGYVPEDFIEKEERPVRRNPLITSILYYSKDVESFGSGLKRITYACKEAGVKVEFKLMKSGFVVVFYRRNSDNGVDKENIKSTQSGDKVLIGDDKSIQSVNSLREKYGKCVELSEKEIHIIEYLGRNEFITNGIARDLLQIGTTAARNYLNGLVKKDILMASGEHRGRRYVLKLKVERNEK